MNPRSKVNIVLLTFFGLTIGAVIFRIDYFPLTWVPMYSDYKYGPSMSVPVGDLNKMNRGFEVKRQNGHVDFIGPKELNIPASRFRRIYYQRAFGEGPVQYFRFRRGMSRMNLALHDWISPITTESIDWQQRVLRSLNETFYLTPGDPDFIISAKAQSDLAVISLEDRKAGRLDRKIIEHREVEIQWSAK